MLPKKAVLKCDTKKDTLFVPLPDSIHQSMTYLHATLLSSLLNHLSLWQSNL